MYRLILVDDEEIVARGIQKVFQLEKFGFELAGTFTNPIRALEKIKQIQPHLIITDIKMPQMDGLEFTRNVLQILPKTQIVILSGYGDFAYAQSAVKLGVSEYILKPVRKPDFQKMLLDMKEKLDAGVIREQQFRIMEEAAIENYTLLKNRYFLTLAQNGNTNPAQMNHVYEQLGLGIRGYSFVLLKIVTFEMQSAEDANAQMERIMGEVLEFSRELKFYEEFYTDEYLYFYYYGFPEDVDIEKYREKVKHYVDWKAGQGIRLLAGVSQIHSLPEHLFFAETECDEAILKTDESSSQTAFDSLFSAENDFHLPYHLMENLFSAVSTGDEDKINSYCTEIFDMPAFVLYRDYAYSLSLIILIKLCHLQNRSGFPYKIITRDMLDIRVLKSRCTGQQALRTYMEMICQQISGLITEDSKNAPPKTILAAVQFVEEHYMEPVSLAQVAEEIHISKNYLCDLFKKELHITFIDYVTKIRTERAKYLLSHTDCKMYEICEQVGYNDYAYFSQIFKRQTGLTLSEYRRMN